MITLLEVLALVTLGGLGAMFLRRRIRRGSALALVFAGLCAALMTPAPASATEFRKGDRVTVAKDEVIHSDLYAAGGQVRVDGTVEGDLVVGAGQVEITGHVLGDVISSSGEMRMIGQVDGNIRGYAGNMTVKGKVGHNVTLCGGDINIDRDAQIGGSATTLSGRVSMDGHVGRDIVALGGQVNIGGNVGGGMIVRSGELNIDSSAQIRGPVNFHGDKPPDVSPQAKLASPVHYEKMRHGTDYSSVHYYIWQIIWAAAYILFGMVLFSLLPSFSQEAVNSAERFGASAGLGILAGFGLPIAACIACVTVVGLFIGLATLALWYGALYFGLVVISALVGQWLMGRTTELWPLIGRMCVGVVIVRLCAMIPDIGWVFKYGAAFWGIGAISLAAYRRFQPVLAAGGAPSATPLPPNTTVGGPLPA